MHKSVDVIQSVEEIETLLADRPLRTMTYQISSASADDVSSYIKTHVPGPPMRLMSVAEIEELAQYLGTPAKEFHGSYMFSDASCVGCGRNLTLLDMAKTGVDQGLHSKDRLAAVLTGKAGNWVTVRGKDGGRRIDCATCSVASQAAINYLCSPHLYHYAY